nr:HAMP domain-containing protein [Geodermatophilus dictyosporus]
MTALLDYEIPGVGDYYLLPRDTGRSVAIEPYLYEVAGEQVLITSLSTPVTVGGRAIGVAGVDVPLAAIQEQVGAVRPYDVGRATLVSSQALVVGSNRPGDEVGAAAAGPVAEVAADAVEGGETVQRTVEGDEGSTVYVAAPIEVGEGQHWAVLVEIPEDAILADAHGLRTTILAGALLTLLLAAGATLLVARRVVAPLDALRSRMEEIADGDGDLTARVDESRTDEIGRLGAAFNRFVAKVAETVTGIGRASGSLVELSAGMSGVSGRLAGSVEQTSAQAQQVSAVAEQLSRNVQTVAAGAEEMGVSIREIASNASEAARIAGEAVTVARHRGADQPARPQRDHRGRPRRRGGQGLRRGGHRGEGPGPGDGEGHRGHHPPDPGDPGRHRPRRGRHRPHRRGGQPDQRLPDDDRQRRRGADRDDQRDVARGDRGGPGHRVDRRRRRHRVDGEHRDRAGRPAGPHGRRRWPR